MKLDRRAISVILLILGMALLFIGISTDNTIFSWAAIACVVISFIVGKRWMKRKRK